MQSSEQRNRTVRSPRLNAALVGNLTCGRDDVEREPVAARDRAASVRPERVANGDACCSSACRRRSRRRTASVGSAFSSLVVEEQDAGDVRLAEGDLEARAGSTRPASSRRRASWRRLGAGVARRLPGRDHRLDPELVVEDRERSSRAAPCRRTPREQRHELVVVGERDGGDVRVREVGRLDRVVRIRVMREAVHDRRRAPAGAVGDAERLRKAVGELVGRLPSGRSEPRGASAPPQTRTCGSTALTAS